MKKTLWIAIVSSLTLAGTACKSNEQPGERIDEPNERVNTQRADQIAPDRDPDRARVDEANENLAEARRQYTEEAKARLARLDARIDELQARTDEKSKEAARDLKVRRDELAARLDRAGGEADSSWEEFKSDVKTGFDNLEKDIDEAF